MASTVTIDLRHIARGLDLNLRQIQAVVELLDEGNTIPFITRYRKDQTGGMDEEQIREIHARLGKVRLLAERKQTILRSIEGQGKLTEKLAQQIQAAATTKRLEDLYLPYKPKKQTLATLARARGLEELAGEILAAAPTCADLDARARDFANFDRQVPTGADALLGAGHILAEEFSERADLRQRLREILQRTGKLITARIGGEPGATTTPGVVPGLPSSEDRTGGQAGHHAEHGPGTRPETTTPAVAPALPGSEDGTAAAVEPVAENPSPPIEPLAEAPAVSIEPVAEAPALPPAEPVAEAPAPGATTTPGVVPGLPSSEDGTGGQAGHHAEHGPGTQVAPPPRRGKAAAAARLNRKETKKKRLEELRIKAFRDYFSYGEELRKMPPHRVLAINRGERARVLRVKIEADLPAMEAVLEELLVPPGHPHAEYLRGCAQDSLARLILPGLEREVRREMTDHAELHAVAVFARNLRNLLLQPPVRGRRVLAVDPGFKSGCKLAALDQFGNILAHDVIYLVGRPERRVEARHKVVDLVRRFQLSVIAIGNGTACRQSEDFFAELVAGELKEQGVAFVIVNEAGASVYSTSQWGREEFPHYDATLRGAISIGRRLQDPLSELVKIDPASIGVGLYQHDVKAKHLRASLDDVVESCVNYVGVDVNTASPALLRYVSGLNQLTARRMYEFRCQNGPFRNRQQFREVAGFGEATFVQAAGFLKISGGENPLDATWIHPESYPVASRVMERLGAAPAAPADSAAAPPLAEKLATLDLDALAKELEVGALTLKDILAQLVRPGRDPREDLPAPVFKQGVLKLEDLSAGMELTGTVLNVVDFGCFVDIGMHDSGLVHVSHMADRYIRDPHEVVAVGGIVKVWVLAVDKERRRVSLTMVPPGKERPPRPRGGPPPADAAGAAPQEGQRRQRGRGRRRPEGQAPAGQPAEQGPLLAQSQGPRPHGAGGPPRPPSRRPQSHSSQSRPPQSRPPQPRPRPRPVVPLTEGMKAGKEPMRTFGDLMQFFEQKHVPGDNKPAAAERGPARAAATVDAPQAVEAAGQPAAVDHPPGATTTPGVVPGSPSSADGTGGQAGRHAEHGPGAEAAVEPLATPPEATAAEPAQLAEGESQPPP
jgi:uncharacterized protein